MHEGHFTEQIVDAIYQALKEHPNPENAEVNVRVGEVFHLEKDSVLMHYQLQTQGTPLEKVKLKLEEVPVRVECRSCGKSGAVEDHHLLVCPECFSRDVNTIAGDSIEVEAVQPA